MDTSGTGHDRCPSQSFPTRQAPGTPPLGGNEKNKKTPFWFQEGRAEKFQCPTDPGDKPRSTANPDTLIRVNAASYIPAQRGSVAGLTSKERDHGQ